MPRDGNEARPAGIPEGIDISVAYGRCDMRLICQAGGMQLICQPYMLRVRRVWHAADMSAVCQLQQQSVAPASIACDYSVYGTFQG